MEYVKESFGSNLKKLRGEKTIEDVCNDLNLNPNVYEAYENDQREPHPNVVKLLSEYFGVEL